MNEQEGVIKYDLIHTHKTISHGSTVADLNAWRSVMFRLGLIGQDPERYGGLGFGNISSKPEAESNVFIISGTQTGHLEQLNAEHYCLIEKADFAHNRIYSSGEIKPSSEALTHACVYRRTPRINAVIHVHSPEIWRNTNILDLPHTEADVAYGTIAMVLAVESLFISGSLKSRGAFSMLGHTDGVVAFGRSLEQAAWELIRLLVRAIHVEQRRH
ncbi:MAG: class II aldolase/adducin family protein [Gammaproteobacteria bacterium]